MLVTQLTTRTTDRFQGTTANSWNCRILSSAIIPSGKIQRDHNSRQSEPFSGNGFRTADSAGKYIHLASPVWRVSFIEADMDLFFQNIKYFQTKLRGGEISS